MIVAYSALAYGIEYLGWSIRSIIDYVDEYHILYAAQGSYGHRTSEPCPDNRDDLLRIAREAAGHKLFWHDGDWHHEGQHRNTIHKVAPHADIIISLDFDEIWQPGLIQQAIETAQRGNVRRWRIPFRHYFRSFYRCILHDPSYPERVYNTHFADGVEQLETPFAVNHMGYAIRPSLARWKWLIHGHKNELRRDCDWFVERYLANAQRDCHPCGNQYWNAEFVNPLDYFPEQIQEHPYFNQAIIE